MVNPNFIEITLKLEDGERMKGILRTDRIENIFQIDGEVVLMVMDTTDEGTKQIKQMTIVESWREIVILLDTYVVPPRDLKSRNIQSPLACYPYYELDAFEEPE